MNEIYKWFGVVGIAIAWTAILSLLLIWDTNRGESISFHAASRRKSYLMMAIIETTTMPLVWLFLVGWLAPVYHLGLLFVILSSLIALGLLLSAWIPVTGPKGKLHDILAQSAAVLSAPTVLILVLSPTLNISARLVSLAACLGLSLMVVLFYTHKQTHKYFLYFQLVSLVLFDSAVLAAAFLR